MDIGEVVQQTGLPPSTLRYYEEKGLIRSTGRRGLRRIFDPSVVERLALIALGQRAGFTLEELAGFLAEKSRPAIDRKRLAEKADELDERIRELTAMRDGLRHAVDCNARSHWECPTFQRLLRRALHGKRQLHESVPNDLARRVRPIARRSRRTATP